MRLHQWLFLLQQYLLAVLNSKLADWYIRQLGVTRNGGYFEYKPMFIEKLPNYQLSVEAEAPYSTLVDKIHEHKLNGESTAEYEATLDDLIFQLLDAARNDKQMVEKRQSVSASENHAFYKGYFIVCKTE